MGTKKDNKKQQDQPEVQAPVHQPTEKKPRFQGVKGFVNSPWLFLVVPVLAGAIWLVNNTWVITNNLDKPYMLALGPVLVVSLIAIKLILNFFSVIEKWIKLQFEKAKQAKRGQFLEFVIAVFMFVSVCEAGPFFNKVQGEILYGALGYVTVFAFDLVAVVCMRGRAKMLRKGHDKQAAIYQFGVWLCALVSVYANFDSSYQNVQLAIQQHAAFDGWFGALAPLVGVVFPIMIVFLSYATDSDDEIDDPTTFKQEQQKKVQFAQAKYEIASAMLAEKVRMDLLKQREFFLKGWFFTKKKINFVIDTVKTEVVAEFEKLKEELAKNLEVVKGELLTELKHAFQPQVQGLRNDLNQAQQRLSQQAQTIEFQASQIDEMRGMIRFLQATLQDVKNECIGSVYDAVKSEVKLEIASLKTPALPRVIEGTKEQKNLVLTQDNQENNWSDDSALAEVLISYPFLQRWLSTGEKSATIDEIVEVTGHSRKMIVNRVNDGTFRKTKNPNKYSVRSIIEWLKVAPLPKSKTAAKEEDNSLIMETDRVPETPTFEGENSGIDTGEYEAIKSVELEELNEDEGVKIS